MTPRKPVRPDIAHPETDGPDMDARDVPAASGDACFVAGDSCANGSESDPDGHGDLGHQCRMYLLGELNEASARQLESRFDQPEVANELVRQSDWICRLSFAQSSEAAVETALREVAASTDSGSVTLVTDSGSVTLVTDSGSVTLANSETTASFRPGRFWGSVAAVAVLACFLSFVFQDSRAPVAEADSASSETLLIAQAWLEQPSITEPNITEPNITDPALNEVTVFDELGQIAEEVPVGGGISESHQEDNLSWLVTAVSADEPASTEGVDG